MGWVKSILLLALACVPAFAGDTMKSKDKFGNVQTYFTGHAPATKEEKAKRHYRDFPGNKGAFAFQEIPKEYVLKEYVQRIFSQQCGDCWAQGAVTAFETLIGFTDKMSTFISRQQVIDCSGFGGCGGGQISLENFKDPKGAVYEDDYKYVGSNQRCKTGVPLHQKAKDVVFLKTMEWPNVQRAIMELGPGEVCGASRSLQNGGWVTKNIKAGEDHCYGIVGWYDGAAHGQPPGAYAIFPNSWGKNWGDAGFAYVRVAMDGVHFDGDVLNEAAFLDYKTACTPQPVVNAGADKAVLVEE